MIHKCGVKTRQGGAVRAGMDNWEPRQEGKQGTKSVVEDDKQERREPKREKWTKKKEEDIEETKSKQLR